MFTGMYFQKNVKVDSKNRMFLPSETEAVAGTEFLIAKMPYYYEIFLLERINAIVEGLQKDFYKVGKNERAAILRDLNYIFAVAIRTSRTDAQRRISMPSALGANSSVILQGRNTSIAVFENEPLYDEYMNRIETSPILR